MEWRIGAWCVTILVTCTVLAGCRDAPGGKGATNGGGRVMAVSVAEARAERIEQRIEVTGTLAPSEEGTLSIEADGRLIEVRADLGTVVGAGDVLARVEARNYAYRHTQAEAELAAASADHRRLEGLLGKDMATRQQVDEAARRQAVARATLDLARKALADTRLRAPFDGVVAKRLVHAGEFVRVGTPAFHLVRVTPLKLTADVPERHVTTVKVGDAVTVAGDALGGRTLTGRIVRIGPAVSETTRAFPIEAEVENPDGTVKPGSFARASIQTGVQSEAITVLESAVLLFSGNPRVFVVREDTVQERVIEVAGRVRDRVVIGKGLTDGERVVITGVELLSDGQRIVVRDQATVPAQE